MNCAKSISQARSVLEQSIQAKIEKYVEKYADQIQQGELPGEYPLYLAFGETGDFIREARTIGELPHELVAPVMLQAKAAMGLDCLSYGVQIWRSLGMRPSKVEADSRDYLKLRGEELPLALFWNKQIEG